MKKITIIGAGVAGLTAGIYAQKAGFETEIYEQHKIAGGQLTGWTRDGYHIDGCIHWLMGTRKYSGSFNTVWNTTGALSNDVEIIKHEYFGIYEIDGKRICFVRDLEQFRKQLLEIAPEDKIEIDILCEHLKNFETLNAPNNPLDLINMIELFKLGKTSMKTLKMMKKLNIAVKDYAERFKNPVLQSMIKDYVVAFDREAISCFIASYSSFLHENADIPRGGSLKMAQRMTAKYIEHGG